MNIFLPAPALPYGVQTKNVGTAEVRQIIHIGGNKTASTLLQRQLFAVHPSIAYIGEGCEGYDQIRRDIEVLIHEDDSFYDESFTAEMFGRYSGKLGKETMVFSNEDLMNSRLSSVCASRLKLLMPDAQVVMVIRNQITTWPSWYANHGAYLLNVPRRYLRRYVSFDEWLDYCFNFPMQTPVEAMNYHRFYEMYVSLFGASNVHVLLYEELETAPRTYYARWAALLGLSADAITGHLVGKREGVRHSQARFVVHRLSSNFPSIAKRGLNVISSNMPSVIRNGLTVLLGGRDGRGPAKIDIPEQWFQRIHDYYARGNTRLAGAAQLDLGSVGYPVDVERELRIGTEQ